MHFTKTRKYAMDAELRQLLKRLKVVYEETGGKGAGAVGKYAGDSFMQLRSRLIKQTKVIHELCDARDADAKKNKGKRSTEAIKRDQEIRTCVVECSEIMQNLHKVHKSLVKKQNKKRVTSEEMREKSEFLGECVREVQLAVERSNRRPGESSDAVTPEAISFNTMSLADALASMDSGPNKSGKEYTSPAPTGPGVEMSASVTQKLEVVERNKQEMDKYLDVIEEGVSQIAEIANTLGEELAVQDQLIADVAKNIEKADDNIQGLNDQVDEVLNDKGQCCQNQALNLICFVLLLGVCGVIIKMISADG